MKYIAICCEGSTEEAFVARVLSPYLEAEVKGILVTPHNMKGASDYKKIRDFVSDFCQSSPYALVTTMIDFYGWTKNIPNLVETAGGIYQQADNIESAVEKDLHEFDNLNFNIIIHEFEGLLFSDVNAFEGIVGKNQMLDLRNILHKAGDNPECINDSFETAPSRRIERIKPDYQKVQDGVEIAGRIGIEKIAENCRHFGRWIERIKTWTKEGAK